MVQQIYCSLVNFHRSVYTVLMSEDMNRKTFSNNTSFSIIQDDITKLNVDAIANAANTSLLGGGGVDGAIHRAAGPELLQACIPLHGCETGKAKITPGFRLPAKYVIHTPGPIWHGGTHNEAVFLASCYKSCLELADIHKCSSIAFPSISTGVYGYPVNEAAEIAIQTIIHFLIHSETNINRPKFLHTVIMVCFDSRTYNVYKTVLNNRPETKA
jgi:O-acetyl-ADP-ribose deacetylase